MINDKISIQERTRKFGSRVIKAYLNQIIKILIATTKKLKEK